MTRRMGLALANKTHQRPQLHKSPFPGFTNIETRISPNDVEQAYAVETLSISQTSSFSYQGNYRISDTFQVTRKPAG
jgi:hypothetical protein